MKALRYIIFTILVLARIANVVAQPKDYEDFFATIPTLADENLYSKLMAFQKQDPYFVSIYVQLGEVSQHLMLKTDPLKDFNDAIYWANTGILYLKLYHRYAKENESRSNREFYANLPIKISNKKLSDVDLNYFVTERIKSLETYRDSLKIIYFNLERAKENYGECIALYNAINKRYSNLNEVWLKADENFLKELETLKIHFDSTLKYFNTYSELTKTFPLRGYTQKYALKPVLTFRLDGLTNSNFLNNNFEIWDYARWIDEFNTVYTNDILKLRFEIDSIDFKFNEVERLVKSRVVNQSYIVKPMYDEKFLFRLGKYDNNSLVRELFAYKSGKQKFLAEWNGPLNIADDTVSGLLPRKARYYYDLVELKFDADSLLTNFESVISEQGVNRFNQFFISSYQGEPGLKKYCAVQKNMLNQLLSESFMNLKKYADFENSNSNRKSLVQYQKDTLPLFSVTRDYKGLFRTTDLSKTSEGAVYIGGFEVVKGNVFPFVSHLDKSGKVKWLKQMEKPYKFLGAQTPMAAKVYGFKTGCVIVYTLLNPGLVNVVVKLDTTGKEMGRYTIPLSTFPIYLEYDDINQKTLMVFKGTANTKNDTLETATMCLSDSAGNITWNASFEVAGSLAGIIRTESSYLAFFNFTSCTVSGKSLSISQSGTQWGNLVVNVDESGKIANYFCLKQTQSILVNHIFKLSSQVICLVGVKFQEDRTNDKLYFSILHPGGKVIYSY